MSAPNPQATESHGLTIVVPTHGGRASVVDAVQAILASDHHDIEVLVVSDGDSQNVRGLLSSVQDPRLHILEQAKQGVGAARNRGLREAKFDWVCFVDDDDVPRPNWLHVWSRELAKDPVAVTAAVAYWRDGRLDRERPCRLDPADPTMSASTLLAGAFWIRTEVARAVGGYDQALRAAENQDLGLRICDFLTGTNPSALIQATDEVVIDLFVQEAKSRNSRYGSSRADAARVFFERFGRRLSVDPQQRAALWRIIARDDRLARRYRAARKASWAAIRTEPFNVQNLRSLGLAFLAYIFRFVSRRR